MCGIVGVYLFGHERVVDPRVLDAMTDVLAHRGPDGRGTHVDGGLGLGHRRLSIIDLSAEAAQPLANEDGSVWVVLNGEIYNFQELRRELENKGHVFRSKSDTEVLVHLYEECGDAFVERLRGMFALAIWDARGRRLVLARDRFGQKPLYYRATPRSLRFASEIKGILEDPAVEREPDLEALHEYLAFGYVPSPRTAFAGIRKLQPGHLMVVEADGRCEIRRYWRLRFEPKRATPGVAEERRARARVLELIDESTRLRMISDVPLGAFLSGGVDSSAIVASMCRARSGDGGAVKTFAIGFDDPGFDESGYAAEVARHLGTHHRRLTMTSEAFTDLEHIAWHYGEPFADASCLPTFAVSALARRHVTVALTGDGGDELFGGYRRYASVQLEEWLRGTPKPLAALARSRPLVAALRRVRRKALANDLERSRGFAGSSIEDLYVSRIEAVPLELRAELYEDGFLAGLGGRDVRETILRAIDASEGETLAERCTHADILTYLPDDILVKVDVASMASGLECRAPLLDHVLAEYVASLPFALKIARLERKRVLKAAVAERLPAWVLKRRKKGFSVPLKSWFEGGIEPLLRETLLSDRAVSRGYFRPARVEGLIREHAEGRANRQGPLFGLLMLEMWHRIWMDPARRAVEPQAAATQQAAG